MALTIVATAFALLVGNWIAHERGVSTWTILTGPVLMILLCLGSYIWLRRRET